MLRFLRKKFSDLEKKILDKQLLKKQKEEQLQIEIPYTTFNQRYYASKLEPILADKLQQNLNDKLNTIRKSKVTKVIINQSSIPLQDGIDLNDIMSKVYCDFDHKYQLIKGENVDIVWNLNVLNKNFFDSLNDINNLELELKKRLHTYIQQMIRWGFPISNINLTVDIDFQYIENLYKTFIDLYQKNIIKKGIEKGYWSIKEQKFITPENYNITYRNVDVLFVSYEINSFGNNKIFSEMFKKEKLYALVMINELEQLCTGNALKINTDQQYLIIHFYGNYYIAEKNFFKSKINQKYIKYKVIEEINGSQLIGWTVKNHFRQNDLQFIEQDNIKLSGTKINLCCPNFNHDDFLLSKNYQLDILDNIDEQGFVLDGELEGYKYFETSDIIKQKIHEYIEDYQIQVEEIKEIKKKVSEEKLILLNKDYFYIYVTPQQQDKIFENLKKIKFIGQTKEQDDEVHELEIYLERNQFRISEENQIGIPIPIVKQIKKRSRNKYKDVSEELLNELKQIPFTQWSSIKLHKISQSQNEDETINPQKFSIEFLQAFNIIYNLQRKSQDNQWLLGDQQEEIQIKRDLDLPYLFTAFNILQNESYLPLSIVLSQVLKNNIPFSIIKRHGIFIDVQQFRLQQSVDVIINGILQDIGHQHYSYGTDAFRFYLAAIDVDQDNFTNIKVIDHLIQNKKAEINVIRQIYKKTFQLINNNFVKDINILENTMKEDKLQLIDKMILNQFQIMKDICVQSYEEKNYNVIYSTFLDFFINYFQNIYIHSIQNDILCKRNDVDLQKQILAYILEESLKIIAPILQFNAENIYQEINWLNKKNCIFEEQQIQLNIKIDLDLLQEAYELNNFNQKIKEFIILLKQKQIIKNNKELDLYLCFNFEPERRSYHKKINLLKEYIEKIPLEYIFDVSKLTVVEETDMIENIQSLEEEKLSQIKIYIENSMIPIQLGFKIIPEQNQCQRCEYYIAKEDDTCLKCKLEINEHLELPKLINNQKILINTMQTKNVYTTLIILPLIIVLCLLSIYMQKKIKERFPNKCVIDSIHYLTYDLNIYFSKKEKAADISLSINGMLMDLYAFLSTLFWILNPSVFYIPSMAMFFGLRMICLYFLTQFPLPEPYSFHFTYPSVVIPSAPTNDLFFSGHIGMAIIATLVFFDQKYYFLGFLGIFVILDIIVALSLTGGHYMNDFIFGAVAAIASFLFVQKYGYNFNMLILKIYTGIMQVFESKSVSEKQDDITIEEIQENNDMKNQLKNFKYQALSNILLISLTNSKSSCYSLVDNCLLNLNFDTLQNYSKSELIFSQNSRVHLVIQFLRKLQSSYSQFFFLNIFLLLLNVSK